MKGAIAAGHPLTARAGARILEEGGNAVDACAAAAFVGWVAESPLTGPGAGGFMLVHRARDGMSALLDFFVAVPGRGALSGGAAMERVEIRFDRQTAQTFLIGPASCSIPSAHTCTPSSTPSCAGTTTAERSTGARGRSQPAGGW